MGKRINVEALPRVNEWVTLPEVSEMMKLSRQQVHRMATDGKFKSLSRIGSYVVVSTAEALDLTLRKGLDTESWRM